ncbi:DUF5818 domain-containing protein [Aestuariivirga sp.]|uniref:DUF5818 domain-containing protein n=1 Tax=Aestuariivirga sp. TaxID=2650926 RepID=UPI0039197682
MQRLRNHLAAALLGASAAIATAGLAQAHPTGEPAGTVLVSEHAGDRYTRGRLVVRPAVAEIGSRVTLIGRDLRPGGLYVLAEGRNPQRLTRVRTVRADWNGRVYARVAVPEWARPDRNLFFALQTPGGRIAALARPIRVVDSDDDVSDRVTITGELLAPTATCPRLAGDDGRIYALAGSLRQFEAGDRVRVTGERAEVSICQQRNTIKVERIRSAE